MAIYINILIIDDDQDICEYMKTMLEALSDPSQAISEIRKEEYHLLIIDLMMPKIDGIELIRQIRKMDNDIAIMIFTGYPSVETAVDALKLNISDYIKKPFDLDDFRQSITDVLRKKGLLMDPEEKLHKAIGQTIRQLRKGGGLTLKQLSRRTSLSVSLLSQIERAESSASVSSLYKIAVALRVPLNSLFGEF